MNCRRALALTATMALAACGDDAPPPASDSGSGGGDSAAQDSAIDSATDSATDSAVTPPTDAGTVTCEPPAMHSGEGTYYDFADGSGNCGFPATPDDLMVAAMNHTDYAASAACGSCAAITGPTGSVTVRIVDQCPECPAGDIDLSPEAFAHIAELTAGRVAISWTYVPCEVTGPIVYHFKDGSNPWWTAVQLRNHRYAVARFEYQGADGAFVDVPRVDYNYFVDDGGMGDGPFTFRVTDVHGSVLTDTNIPLLDDGDAPGTAQFPVCD